MDSDPNPTQAAHEVSAAALAGIFAAIAVAVGIIGKSVDSFLGVETFGKALTGGLMIMVLISGLMYFAKTRFQISDIISGAITKLVVLVVLSKVGYLAAPIMFNLLPDNIANTIRNRSDDTAMRFRQKFNPIDTGFREVTQGNIEKNAGDRADELRVKLEQLDAKRGKKECWGWDGKKSIPNQSCTNQQIDLAKGALVREAEVDVQRQYEIRYGESASQKPSPTGTFSFDPDRIRSLDVWFVVKVLLFLAACMFALRVVMGWAKLQTSGGSHATR